MTTALYTFHKVNSLEYIIVTDELVRTMVKNKIYVPGEVITTEEEYAPGKNTFEDKGYVKASGFGTANFDEMQKEVSLKSKKVETLKRDDIVYCRVSIVKDSVVIVNIVKAENDKALIVSRGQIPAKFVAKAYIRNVKEFYKVGDYIKAKVISASNLAVDLATNEKGLGVIIAYCTQCKSEMKFSNEKLTCFNCGHTEGRKWFEAKDEMEDRPQNIRRDRNGFGSRDRNHSHDRSESRNNFNKRQNYRGGRR